jgi:hypothetical protein
MKYIKTYELKNSDNKIYIHQSRDGDVDTFILGKLIKVPLGIKIDGYIFNDYHPEKNGNHIIKYPKYPYNFFVASPEEIEQYEYYNNINKYNL